MPPGMAASWQQQQQPFNYPPPGSLYSQQGPYSQGASPPPAGVYAGGWPQGLPPGSTVSWQESLGMGPAPVNSQQPPAADFYSNPSPMMGPAPGYAEYMEAAAPLPAQGGGGGGGYSDNGPPQAATGWAASPQALDDAPYGYGTSSYSPPAGTPDMNVSGSYYPPPSTAGYFGPGDSRVPPLPPAVKALPPVERIEDWDD